MLVRCLYASRSLNPVSQPVLDGILAQSRKNNVGCGVTGLLCFSRSTFVQVIEGGRDGVCRLYNRIAQDVRHHDVCLLSYEEIRERQFGNWSMGQVSLDTVNPALMLKYFERAEFDPFNAPAHATASLLTELLAAGSIVSRASA